MNSPSASIPEYRMETWFSDWERYEDHIEERGETALLCGPATGDDPPEWLLYVAGKYYMTYYSKPAALRDLHALQARR